MTLNEISNIMAISNARGSFQHVCKTKDAKGVLNFLRTVNVMLTAAFLLFAAIGIMIAVFITVSTSSRVSAVMPQEAGAAPSERVIDETGYVHGDQLDYILRATENLAKDTHIQLAVYNSFDAPTDLDQLYGQVFPDDKGILIYIHEEESSGQIYFRVGEGLTDVFTAPVMEEMERRVAHDMEYFTHNRAERVIEALWKFLPGLFEDNSYNNVFNYLTAVFWVIMGPVLGWGTVRLCCVIIGIPGKRSARRALIVKLKEMQ